MSLTDRDDQSHNGAAASALGGTSRPGAGPQSTARGFGGERQNSVLSANGRLTRRFARSTAGESVLRFKDTLTAIFQNKMGDDLGGYKLLVLDNQSFQTAFSAIIVARMIEHEGQRIVAMTRLLVETTGPSLPPEIVQIGGQSAEIQRVTGDADNNIFVDKCAEVLTRTYGSGIVIKDAGANVLPNELDPNDESRMHSVAYFATAAVETTLDIAVGFQEDAFRISWIGQNDNLSAKLDYHPMPVETATGLPIRSDIAIVLNAAVNNQGDVLSQASLGLARVDGFVDLVFSPPPPQAIGAQPDTRHYYAQYVITRATGLLDAISLETQLLPVITAMLLNNQLAWANVFKPRIEKGINIRDIGAIGLELPFLMGKDKGTRVPTTSTSFGADDFYKLITTAIHPNLIFSMDVEECAEMSFANLIFIAAANGNPKANAALYDAMNTLTDGHFEQQYPRGNPIVVDDNNRIHLGYYIDEKGNQRDLRDVDYLALLNLQGDHGLQAVYDWSSTFYNLNEPEPLRLDRRWKLINAVNQTSVLKGYARRVSFVPAAMAALDTAAKLAGLAIRPSNLVPGGVGVQQRGFAGAASLALGNGVGGVFSFASTGNQWNRTPGAAARWGRSTGF